MIFSVKALGITRVSRYSGWGCHLGDFVLKESLVGLYFYFPKKGK